MQSIDAFMLGRVTAPKSGEGGGDIDDNTIATDKTWSSTKINFELGRVSQYAQGVQTETHQKIGWDTPLDTDAQTLAAAINELNAKLVDGNEERY